MKQRHARHPRRRPAPFVSIARLNLGPEDVLVLHVPARDLPPPDQMRTLVKRLRDQLGRPVVVLGPGMRFGIVRSHEDRSGVIAQSNLPQEHP